MFFCDWTECHRALQGDVWSLCLRHGCCRHADDVLLAQSFFEGFEERLTDVIMRGETSAKSQFCRSELKQVKTANLVRTETRGTDADYSRAHVINAQHDFLHRHQCQTIEMRKKHVFSRKEVSSGPSGRTEPSHKEEWRLEPTRQYGIHFRCQASCEHEAWPCNAEGHRAIAREACSPVKPMASRPLKATMPL